MRKRLLVNVVAGLTLVAAGTGVAAYPQAAAEGDPDAERREAAADTTLNDDTTLDDEVFEAQVQAISDVVTFTKFAKAVEFLEKLQFVKAFSDEVARQEAQARAAEQAARTSRGGERTTASGGGGAGGSLACIRNHESGGNYGSNTGNGYYGAYQFSQSTWQSVGGTGSPAAASPAEQDMRAQQLLDRSGSGQWPNSGC